MFKRLATTKASRLMFKNIGLFKDIHILLRVLSLCFSSSFCDQAAIPPALIPPPLDSFLLFMC
jgi:hypothetical protein